MRCRIRCGIVYEHDRLNTHTHITNAQMKCQCFDELWANMVELCVFNSFCYMSMSGPGCTEIHAKACLDSILCGEGSTHNAQKLLTEAFTVSQLVVLESINRRCVERNHEDNSDSNGFQFQNSPRNSGCQGFAAKRRLHCRVPWSTLIPTHLFAAASHLTETDFTTSRTYQKIDNEARIGCTSYCFVFE